jgi:hypothetical protein
VEHAAVVVERLPAEDEHRVLVERGADDRPRRVVDRSRVVGAVDPRGEDGVSGVTVIGIVPSLVQLVSGLRAAGATS